MFDDTAAALLLTHMPNEILYEITLELPFMVRARACHQMTILCLFDSSASILMRGVYWLHLQCLPQLARACKQLNVCAHRFLVDSKVVRAPISPDRPLPEDAIMISCFRDDDVHANACRLLKSAVWQASKTIGSSGNESNGKNQVVQLYQLGGGSNKWQFVMYLF